MKEKTPALLSRALFPDLALGSHTATLGLVFTRSRIFPKHYQNGVFLGQHGSSNRSSLSGYKVLFIPFKKGKPSGAAEDFLSGFIADREKNDVCGRPDMVSFDLDGALLLADDAGNTIWRVSPVSL